MRQPICLEQMFARYMGVNLRRGERRVAEEFLDRPYIRARVHEVGGEGVAQHMRAALFLLADKESSRATIRSIWRRDILSPYAVAKSGASGVVAAFSAARGSAPWPRSRCRKRNDALLVPLADHPYRAASRCSRRRWQASGALRGGCRCRKKTRPSYGCAAALFRHPPCPRGE